MQNCGLTSVCGESVEARYATSAQLASLAELKAPVEKLLSSVEVHDQQVLLSLMFVLETEGCFYIKSAAYSLTFLIWSTIIFLLDQT